jgi:hypothetical protein
MKVVSVEEIDITMTGSSNTATLSTTVGDLSQSVVVGTWEMASIASHIGAESIMCDLYLSNTSTLTIERGEASGATITATCFVIEFDSSVVVQKGTFSMGAAVTTDNVTVTAVDLGKAFSAAYYKHAFEAVGSSDSDPDTRMVSNALTTTTNLAFVRDAGTGAVDGHWWIAEDSNSTITRETLVKDVNNEMAQHLAASRSVVLADSFLIGSQSSVNVEYNDEATCDVRFSGTTGLRFSDGFNSSDADTLEVYVVEDTALTVQEFTLTGSDTATSFTKTITSTDLTLSIILPTMINQGTVDTGFNPGNLDERFVRASFNSATEVQLNRGAVAQTQGGTFQIIEFEQGAAAGKNMQINVGDVWKDVADVKINVGDVWKDVVSVKINIGDSWKTIF